MLKPLTRCLMRIVTANMSPTSFLQFVQPLLLLLQLLLIDRLWLGLGVFGWIARWTSRHMLSGKRWIRSRNYELDTRQQTTAIQIYRNYASRAKAWRNRRRMTILARSALYKSSERILENLKREILKWTLASKEAADDEVDYKFVGP
ncbi:Hypothetical_protein [Hexamita inflata]|uniref:Hypothetical_protein n=1 Tax=Hexamita inflata TaxID=28002 RepID=A0AA86QIS7_9EUKA|nr:Hypothetical protein HINF_LOCUS42983 [Hexamita inflata]